MSKTESFPTRRSLLLAAGSIAATGILAVPTRGAAPAVPEPFSRPMVVDRARELAKTRYRPPATDLPVNFANLSLDQYRDIRFRPEAQLWNANLPFRLQLFHRGLYSKERVGVSIVDQEGARPISYSSEMFNFGDLAPRPLPPTDIGFGGIKLLGLINKSDQYDEIAVFQGASYFRAVGRNQHYGISARGIAIKTADQEGEEFPLFRQFWIETPAPNSSTIVIHALLDGPSVTGAYRFTIRPGQPTMMDVEATLFPRVDLAKVGLAPETSMYFFSANGRRDVDDFRPEVHDSDGLLMYNGGGEMLWRSLANPKMLQISAFVDNGPRGFGLIQRNRSFASYQDPESRYEARPSLWVEPIGNWGPGSVNLVEIPSDAEANDNIVAYWAPRELIPAKSEFTLAYRLSWGGGPAMPEGMVFVAATRRGAAPATRPPGQRMFVVDFAYAGPKPAILVMPKANVSVSSGTVGNVAVRERPDGPGWRVSFQMDPKGASSIEMRTSLEFPEQRPAEVWMYRWTGE